MRSWSIENIVGERYCERSGATVGRRCRRPARPPCPTSPAPFDALRDHVLAHSVKRGDFTLKSGATSSWFLDTKQTACRPEGIVLVADAALSIIPDEATAIGGLTMGADPVAFGVAAIGATRGRGLRSFSVRKEAKDHGVTGRLAGALQPGDRVVITEDTVTRGHVADGGRRGRAGRSAPSRC